MILSFVVSLTIVLFFAGPGSSFMYSTASIFNFTETVSAAQSSKREIAMQERSGDFERKFVTEAQIGAVGDVLLHERVYDDAWTGEGYDFLPMLEPIKPHLMELDFLMANQESIPGGTEVGLSTYPLFNSPRQIADDLREVGVDFLSMANNHSLDAGLEGIKSAVSHLREIGMPYAGVYDSHEDLDKERIMTVNDIDFGVLSYTYGTNGIPIPSGHEYAVTLLDSPTLEQDIRELSEVSDVVIVHAHWGDEYVRTPNAEQQRLAQQIVDAGADIIIGHHPHVLQPIEWLEDDSGREAVVFYSLGNFLTGQVFEYTDIGGIARLNVRKTTQGDEKTIELSSPDILPTFVHHEDHDDHRVILLEDAYEQGVIDKSHEKMVNHVESMME